MQAPVRAKSFFLVDDEGRARARWRVTNDGMPNMTMMGDEDEDGSRAVVYTGLDMNGKPFLHLRSQDGEARITLGFSNEGEARLNLQNADGTRRTVTP
jgi:hypothetical protein